MADDRGRDPRYETLDAWRGLACLMVVVYHSGFALEGVNAWGDSAGAGGRWLVVAFVRQLDLGVALFFAISGYCIAASLDGHLRRGTSPWAFLGRRIRRIYPPYWAALLAFVATVWTLDRVGLHEWHASTHSLELDSPGKLGWPQWLGNVTLTETWRSKVFGGPASAVFTRVAWSLCYEEQFYLVCFATLLVAPRRVFQGLAAATVAIVGFRVVVQDVYRPVNYETWLGGMFPDRWHEFAVGLAVYWRLVRADSTRGKRAVEAGLFALAAVGLGWGERSTWVVAGFGLALIGLKGWDRAAGRIGWLRPLRACGRRSYSIYLIHLLACTVGSEGLYRWGLVGFWERMLVTIPLVSIAAVGVGWAFFRGVESRFLNPPGDRRPGDRPVAGEEAPVGPVEAAPPAG